MSLWFAERTCPKFKPYTLLCALPHRQLPPCLAFIALVLTELFSRTGIKLMGAIGTAGTRRSLAVFAHQHSLAPCTGWFGRSSGGDTAAGSPLSTRGRRSLSANLSPGEGRNWGLTPCPGAMCPGGDRTCASLAAARGDLVSH